MKIQGRHFDKDTTHHADSQFGKLPVWNLDDLYPGPESAEFSRDATRMFELAAALEENYKGKLAGLLKQSPQKFARAIGEYETIGEIMGRMMSYAMLLYTGNTSDPKVIKFYGDAQEKITTASGRLLFFTLEINQLDEEALNKAIAAEPELAHYQPWLEDTRRDKPYQLDDQLEKLFLEKSVTSASAWNRLFDETMSALRFNVDGEELTVEAALNLLQNKDRKKRETAALEIGRVLSARSSTFTLTTNTLAKDLEISNRWRGFKDVAASRHHANRVEPHVVDALADAVQQSFPRLSHRYYAMKAKWMGLDKLQYWDRNAPLPTTSEQEFSWQNAQDIVLSAYSGFSPQMAEIANKFFENNWIDAPVRSGKSPGAFAHPTVPAVHPYVMVNYLGTPRDVMTLAHELGHGVHQVLAAKQGPLMSQTPLTLAETASVFGEMLTFRSLLKQCETAKERKALLARKVEDMLNTVVRQIAFYLFERNVHLERRNGELTSERIGEIWMQVQSESLGPVFEFDPGYAIYWSYVPHFIHSPFYVYAYAFGDCLVNSLYSVYEQGEAGFQEKYFDMLKAGGTKHYGELLEPFGLDAGKPDFWYKGLAMIEGFINELEKLDDVA